MAKPTLKSQEILSWARHISATRNGDGRLDRLAPGGDVYLTSKADLLASPINQACREGKYDRVYLAMGVFASEVVNGVFAELAIENTRDLIVAMIDYLGFRLDIQNSESVAFQAMLDSALEGQWDGVRVSTHKSPPNGHRIRRILRGFVVGMVFKCKKLIYGTPHVAPQGIVAEQVARVLGEYYLPP